MALARTARSRAPATGTREIHATQCRATSRCTSRGRLSWPREAVSTTPHNCLKVALLTPAALCVPDNSNSALGNFYEGIMVTGNTTDATDDLVQVHRHNTTRATSSAMSPLTILSLPTNIVLSQANIVAAGYKDIGPPPM